MQLSRSLMVIVLLLTACSAQKKTLLSNTTEHAPIPEMQKLESAFVGDWKTTESMERSQIFPNGGTRSGVASFRLGPGGFSLIGEGRSDGSAGKLEFMIIIWWDPSEHLYQYFVCFNSATRPCRMRGTAHWEGDKFVNEYESMEGGKLAKWEDTFLDFTPDSFTLVATQMENGSIKPMITTKWVRRK